MQKQKQYHSKGSALIVMCVERGWGINSTRLDSTQPKISFTLAHEQEDIDKHKHYLLEESLVALAVAAVKSSFESIRWWVITIIQRR